MTIPKTMQCVLLTGHGGLEKLKVVNDRPVPVPGDGEVLIKVSAAGINNTDINTRIGWYSKSVTSGTADGATAGIEQIDEDDASWSGAALSFPRIQGADACGVIVAIGAGVPEGRIGERVLVRALQPQPLDERGVSCITFGSEVDGGFAEYAVAKSDMTVRVDSDLSDVELASFPCAYSTAENMLHRIGLNSGETVLVTGASGGVGSAAVQLAKRRGAHVIAVASPSKHDFVASLGADAMLDRDADYGETPGEMAVDVVVDLVAGERWPALIRCIKRGGRYITAGAIGGPITEIDIRTLYLHDLTLAGSTYQPMEVFEHLVGYIERKEIRPVVSKVYPFSQIAEAQTDFIAKRYPGKLVLVPDRLFKQEDSEWGRT
ncbi:alcohol dehydrogenase family protein [Oricola cellulosilytica]|uniref:Alcohol dehydrogenase n=1 Tax=Oricola cellulosilytica TaxID=1429082 RepID=A0A4R0PCM9_9HYPH|nr:alcohol dehydrogenase family protein [Oricola cellulosilytica]TCD15036.1 alcohol dehydrogenase [Oricola cellulosilytica]